MKRNPRARSLATTKSQTYGGLRCVQVITIMPFHHRIMSQTDGHPLPSPLVRERVRPPRPKMNLVSPSLGRKRSLKAFPPLSSHRDSITSSTESPASAQDLPTRAKSLRRRAVLSSVLLVSIVFCPGKPSLPERSFSVQIPLSYAGTSPFTGPLAGGWGERIRTPYNILYTSSLRQCEPADRRLLGAQCDG